MLPLNISPKADRLLACSVPANFHYVTAPLKREEKWRNFMQLWFFIRKNPAIIFGTFSLPVDGMMSGMRDNERQWKIGWRGWSARREMTDDTQTGWFTRSLYTRHHHLMTCSPSSSQTLHQQTADSLAFKHQRQRQQAAYVIKQVKVVHTRLPIVRFRSWSRFLAVSLQVTWVINPAVGCYYVQQACSYPRNP